jgi:hypothetical protein
MAVTLTIPTAVATESFVLGNARVTLREGPFSASYATGGEPVTAAQLGLQVVYFAIATLKTAGTGSVTQLWFDQPNMKVKAYAAAAEIANAVDLSAVHMQILAFGK